MLHGGQQQNGAQLRFLDLNSVEILTKVQVKFNLKFYTEFSVRKLSNDQHRAVIAADQDAKTDVSKFLWILAGFVGNIVGIII